MNVQEAIAKRRAYRALDPVEIPDETVRELAGAAQLMPSCFNNQPWRFVFARSPEALERMRRALNKGNEWAHHASTIVAAFARREHDCLIKEREYYLFDLGMAVSAMLLRATEMGLVAHPIAGYDPDEVRRALGIPDDCMVITLIIIGKKSDDLSALSEWQAAQEPQRPVRLPLETIYSIDRFDERMNAKVER
ncbi:MAG TPA: nitroreductase family protein [Spirochaetota bacterium]|nr:nitroreductase family protein [Spirochaetota bacterium]HOS40798.1 nitroreductase family protein [Spirochaetota bacterium]HPU90192.1 nitroreductase family protein [Spirochaetota bacterium]